MGLFRKRAKQEPTGRSKPRGACECREHVDDLLDLQVPAAAQWVEVGPETVATGSWPRPLGRAGSGHQDEVGEVGLEPCGLVVGGAGQRWCL